MSGRTNEPAPAARLPRSTPAGGQALLPTNPYTAHEAAVLLGCSPDTLERHYGDLHGYRVGRRIRFPRWAIDRLVRDPSAGDGGDLRDSGTPLTRVLMLLPLLSDNERMRVAQAALTAGSPMAGTAHVEPRA
jgi:excisionase family DNA binding protein